MYICLMHFLSSYGVSICIYFLGMMIDASGD